MKIIAAMLFALLVPGCATNYGWSVTDAGCSPRGLQEALFSPAAAELGLTDIRIGRLPDTGQGPGLLVHFNRRLDPATGIQLAPPQLIIGVGDWKHTCVIVVPETQCPAAHRAYAALSTASIPIGFAFDQPEGINVMHGTQYFLLAVDGQHNVLNWSYYGPGHPLQNQIESALSSIEQCAGTAYGGFKSDGL